MHGVLVYSASQYRQRTRLESSLVPIFSESMFVSPCPHLHRDGSSNHPSLRCANLLGSSAVHTKCL